MSEGRSRSVNLGSDHWVPYPEPTSAAATTIGKGNRRVDTRPERRLRSALHARGLRFRKDLYVREGDVRVHIDIAFTRRRIAVFLDGCFWHGCPDHGTAPRSNSGYWGPKLAANQARDRRVDAALGEAGWLVLRAWEHEPVEEAADRVERAWRERAPAPGAR